MNDEFKIKCSPCANVSNSSYFTPIQIQNAYGLNLISNINGKPMGYGIKIAIITCYHYSNLQSDLNKYCSKYSLVPTTLNIINQAGNSNNSNWALESCLNTQMINTVAPGATLYVVESKSNSLADIKTAVTTAVNLGVNIISMSFGYNEFSQQSSSEYLFMNSGIAFICSSGDNNLPLYPSTSANVIAIGGTTLHLNNDNTRNSETTWSTSGCGISVYTAVPNYQNGVNNGSKRNTPDISLVAASGFNVLCSILGGYLSVNGTSLGCPLFSGIVAIANQIRKNSNKPTLNSISTSSLCLQKYLYQTIYINNSLYSNCMYDITSGNDGNYNAGLQYDIATGLGSIKANGLCSQLLNL